MCFFTNGDNRDIFMFLLSSGILENAVLLLVSFKQCLSDQVADLTECGAKT